MQRSAGTSRNSCCEHTATRSLPRKHWEINSVRQDQPIQAQAINCRLERGHELALRYGVASP